MAKVTALQPVRHDGAAYEEGDEFEVKDKADLDQLEASGAVVVKGRRSARAIAADEAAAAAAAAEAADAAAVAAAAAGEAQVDGAAPASGSDPDQN